MILYQYFDNRWSKMKAFSNSDHVVVSCRQLHTTDASSLQGALFETKFRPESGGKDIDDEPLLCNIKFYVVRK